MGCGVAMNSRASPSVPNALMACANKGANRSSPSPRERGTGPTLRRLFDGACFGAFLVDFALALLLTFVAATFRDDLRFAGFEELTGFLTFTSMPGG
jgi:hypothetical protein